MPTKVCIRCGIEKDVAEFAIARSNKDGLQRWCRECRKEHDRIVHPNRKHNKHYDDEHGKKTCRKCGVKKDIIEFSKNKKNRDGTSSYCKECAMKYQESKHPNMKHRAQKSKSPGMKICTSCRIEKPIGAFSKNKNKSDGLSSWCKECVTEYYLVNNPDKKRRIIHICKPGFKFCPNCGSEKELSDFYIRKSGSASSHCKDCIRLDAKEYRDTHGEKVKELKRISYLKAHPPKPEVEKIKIPCGYCGTVFEVTQCGSNRKYCSKECYAKDHVGEKNGFFGKTHSDEFKEQQRILLTGHVESEETKNKKRVANLKRYEDPKEHERTSNLNKKRFEDPAQREIQRANQLRIFEERPEFKESSIQVLKNIIKTPEHKAKIGRAITGEKNGCWKGGTSFLPYCPKFNNALKENVRSFFDDKCVMCGKTSEENKASLAVHHVFTEKMACCETKIEEMDIIRSRLPKNVARFGEDKFSEEEIMYIRMMVPLCRGCHGKQSKSSEKLSYEDTEYRKFFVELILTKYGGKCYNTGVGDTK